MHSHIVGRLLRVRRTQSSLLRAMRPFPPLPSPDLSASQGRRRTRRSAMPSLLPLRQPPLEFVDRPDIEGIDAVQEREVDAREIAGVHRAEVTRE